MFAVERFGDVAGNHAVDDLRLLNHFTVLEDLQAGAFNHQVVLVACKQVSGPDFGDELGVWILLRIICVESVFVLDEKNGGGAVRSARITGPRRCGEWEYVLLSD